ncbi:MAG: type pilus assembly ATPase PilB, type pilus assembly protein PilB, partial [Candidatus Parcubacteria bacterium]
CKECKKARTVNEREFALISKILATHPKAPTVTTSTEIFDEVGCEKCNGTGFKGRQGVYEAIRVDQAVEAAIINDPREHIILKAAQKQGIPSMAEDGIEKVLEGKTSLAELQRVVDLTVGRHNNEDEVPQAAALDVDFQTHVV